MSVLRFYTVIFFMVIFLLMLEYLVLWLLVRTIPIRILINGTRGKTTMVRMLYRLLAASGRLTFAKTTGDRPQVYLPDGRVRDLRRWGPADIRENIRTLMHWIRYKPQAVVMECMALLPETQSVLSRRIFHPTHIAITNIKPDHLEVMGSNREEISRALWHCITPGSQKFLPASWRYKFTKSGDREDRLIHFPNISFHRTFDHIPPAVVAESWGLLKEIAESLHLDPQLTRLIFEREWQEIDRQLAIPGPGLNFTFYNLFSMNDPETAADFIQFIRQQAETTPLDIALLNIRPDRPLRTRQFAGLTARLFTTGEVWVMGKGTYLLKRFSGQPDDYLPSGWYTDQEKIYQRLQQGFSSPVRVFGLVNHQGVDDFLKKLRTLS